MLTSGDKVVHPKSLNVNKNIPHRLYLESEVKKGSLLTIYTDSDINNLALELQISVAKLHKIDQSSRRKSPIKLTLFAFDDIELDVSENLIGREIYKQYNQLRKKIEKTCRKV